MSNLNLRSVTGKDGLPVQFPTGIAIGSGALGGVNNIGVAGQAGFGVGVCPGPLPAGMGGLPDYQNVLSDNYGNYQYSDGSVMCWIPAFYYKWGTGANGVRSMPTGRTCASGTQRMASYEPTISAPARFP